MLRLCLFRQLFILLVIWSTCWPLLVEVLSCFRRMGTLLMLQLIVGVLRVRQLIM